MWGEHHEVLSAVAALVGHDLAAQLPVGLHVVFHTVLLAMPVAFAAVVATWLLHLVLGLRSQARRERKRTGPAPGPLARGVALPPGVFGFVLKFSRRRQWVLVATGLAAMPLLYATLELPKIIINGAIDSGHFPVSFLWFSLDQTYYLMALSGLFLAATILNGAVKFWINVYKGRTGERLLRRLRLTAYRCWCAGAGGPARAQVIPLISQEVEPVGGFAADAFALPVFQGGTFLTILIFMFAQDPVLGAAAVTLLPVQLALIPRLQKRVNRLARQRVAGIRRLGGLIGEQLGDLDHQSGRRDVAGTLKEVEDIRIRLQRTKYFIKALSNFLTALTPFFFYSIGGYLVIEGRLSLGALVAVLSAYKDFTAPLRELFRYYQTMEDVRVRYDEILTFLDQPRQVVEPLPANRPGAVREARVEPRLSPQSRGEVVPAADRRAGGWA